MHIRIQGLLATLAACTLFNQVWATGGPTNTTANDMITSQHESAEALYYAQALLLFPGAPGYAHAANIDLGDYLFYLLGAIQDAINGLPSQGATPSCTATYTAYEQFATTYIDACNSLVDIINAPDFTQAGINYITNQLQELEQYLPVFIALFANACQQQSVGIVTTGGLVFSANTAAFTTYFFKSLSFLFPAT